MPAPYLVWRLILLRLHLKMLKYPLAGSTAVKRCSDILHVMFIQKFALDHIKERTANLLRPFSPLFFGGNESSTYFCC